MILVLEPYCDSLTSSCAYNMEIWLKELDLTITQPAQRVVWSVEDEGSIMQFSVLYTENEGQSDPEGRYDCRA